jgi:hypothetical protein
MLLLRIKYFKIFFQYKKSINLRIVVKLIKKEYFLNKNKKNIHNKIKIIH